MTFGQRLMRDGWTVRAMNAMRAIRFSGRLHAEFLAAGIDVVVASSIRASLLMSVTRASRRTSTILFAQNSIPLGLFAAAALVGADRLALISAGSSTTFPSWIGRRFRSRTVLLPSGRSLERYSADAAEAADASRRTDGEAPRRLRIVSVCGISERKGLHDLIEAIGGANGRGSDLTLTVVGAAINADAERYRAALVDLARPSGVDVEWAGWQDDVRPYLLGADVFALASYHEGLPGVIIEAMAAGLPVVATDAGGCREIVEDGDTGFVVPVGDVDALRDAFLKLSRDDGRLAMGRRGRLRAEAQFTVDAFWSRFAEVVSGTIRR